MSERKPPREFAMDYSDAGDWNFTTTTREKQHENDGQRERSKADITYDWKKSSPSEEGVMPQDQDRAYP